MSSSSSKLNFILKDKRIISLLFVVLMLITIPFIILFKESKKNNIQVLLNGQEKQKLAVNSDYLDLGFKIIENDKEVDIKNIEYKVENNVDKSILGTYEVIYFIKYEDKEYELKRIIEVVDNLKPVINLNSDIVEVYYCKKENTIKLDYTAIDNYDGVITDKVVETRNEDHILLSITDSSGNTTTKKVDIKITEKPNPYIEIKGSKIQYIPIFGNYKEDGAIINDGCGKILNGSIEISNNINTNIAGTYKVTYQYKISDYTLTNERTVVVYEKYNDTIHSEENDKVIYLTFDDGPGQYTEKLLNILKKYNIKATFFVTNQFQKYTHLIQREYAEGHTVAVHTLTHKWSIYRSVETYVKDFNDMNDIIYKYTGSRSKIFRFPGGSSNTISKSYSKGVVSAIKNKMTENGYVYFDWNVDSNDAGGASRNAIYNNVISGINKKKNSVVLMHDIKKNTILAIEDIINYGLANGYRFEALNENSVTVHHGIRN